jgi:ribonuclease HII
MPKAKHREPLNSCYNIEDPRYEIGIDEVGRGPMFGRVYSAAVILPKDDTFKHEWMKDSKRFHSEKKIKEVAEYIKQNSIKWSIGYESEEVIDKQNIRNATYSAMHKAVGEIIDKTKTDKYHILVDGNDFKPYMVFNEEYGLQQIPHTTIIGGDDKYTAIAAASILAKVARDEYISELCEKEPQLIERYDLLKNKGYGTKKHMEGIMTHGINEHHRKSFGICRNYNN